LPRTRKPWVRPPRSNLDCTEHPVASGRDGIMGARCCTRPAVVGVFARAVQRPCRGWPQRYDTLLHVGMRMYEREATSNGGQKRKKNKKGGLAKGKRRNINASRDAREPKKPMRGSNPEWGQGGRGFSGTPRQSTRTVAAGGVSRIHARAVPYEARPTRHGSEAGESRPRGFPAGPSPACGSSE